MPRHATKTSYKPGRLHPCWKGGIERLDLMAKSTTENYCRKRAREIVGAKKNYVVHHIDGDVTNNKKSNLMIITQSQHIAIHNKQRRGIKRLSSLRHKIKNIVLSMQGSSREIARILGIGKTTVLRIRREYGNVTIT